MLQPIIEKNNNSILSAATSCGCQGDGSLDTITPKEYIKGYLKSRNLKKEDLERREYTKQKEDLIQQLTKRSNLSKRKIAILVGVNREMVRKVSEEPSP